ncbi:hypothetical protein [Spirosoma spitsbergense]|uniref:hypothetical protein n=1 Tax=Spirosoma spitsbergense TaxID=431554 RepID=UPI0003744374|nr:hypothetical protein [Spirosoma spitsbergense]
MNHPIPSPEHRAYLASISHLFYHFDLKQLKREHRNFHISPESVAKVDLLVSLHNVPAELKKDLYWIFGYMVTLYTVDFDENRKTWEEERDFYGKPETKAGIELYRDLNLPYWEAVESISIKVKPGWTVDGEPQESEKISYPPMIRFILEAIEEKRNSEWDSRSGDWYGMYFLADEEALLDKYTADSERYEDEIKANNILPEPYRTEKNERLKKERRTKHSLSDKNAYLNISKKKTIDGLYNYLFNYTQFSTQALCRFGAELMFEAGVPFNYKDVVRGKVVATGIHDVFCDGITQQFKNDAPIRKRPVSSGSDRLKKIKGSGENS